jgi:hypothetical protein
MIEKLGGELTDIIEDFMRAVDVEALCSAKRSGQCLLSEFTCYPISVVSSRARALTWTAQICPGWLPSGLPLHGRHSQVTPQGNYRLGEQ